MKRFTIALISFSIALCQFSVAADPTADFKKANSLYQKQEYDSAIRVYEKLIASSEGRNAPAEVYYNLSNCYYKTGNVSKSILNYERTLKINPDDEDALFNLHVAQL